MSETNVVIDLKAMIPKNVLHSMKHKDLRINLKRIDDCSEIRDSTPYVGGGFIKVVGEPNPSSDWKNKLEAIREAEKPMDRSADISAHKLITRRNKGRIEVLMPEPTRKARRPNWSKNGTLSVTEQIEKDHIFADK